MRHATVLALTLLLPAPALFAAEAACTPINYCVPWVGRCATGMQQSPIANNARDRSQGVGLGDLSRYTETSPVPMRVLNTGTNLKVSPVNGRQVKLRYDGSDIVLDEFHFHTPAEHKLDIWLVPCQNFAVAELHLVHRRGNKVIVVAVPIYVGAANAGLSALMTGARLAACQSKAVTLSPTALNALLPAVTGRYITYEGSLTTPDCDENVTFLLLNGGISATQAQLDYIKIAYNARPVQKNGNRVTFRP